MPLNTVKIDRSTKWGNRYAVRRVRDAFVGGWLWEIEDTAGDSEINTMFYTREEAVEASLVLFREYAKSIDATCLAGQDVACWCKQDAPCHGDIWLEIANHKV